MISNEIVMKAEQYLFGSIQIPEEFHKALTDFMIRKEALSHSVVLYKISKEFRELLSQFPELPDIERKEFVVLDSGKLKFSPDYFSNPLQTISCNTFITDKVLNIICTRLFGANNLPQTFLDAFKAFLTEPSWDIGIHGMELCKSNYRFMRFLSSFYYLPDIKMKKLTLYSDGRMTFTTNYRHFTPTEISLK